MNIAMEQTEEYENGQLKAKYGDAFIRGARPARVHARSRTSSVCSIAMFMYPSRQASTPR